MFLTENRLGRNEMWCAENNHSHMCKRIFLHFNTLIKHAVIDKISIFRKIAPNFTYSQKS